jgi:hypothetical protein
MSRPLDYETPEPLSNPPWPTLWRGLCRIAGTMVLWALILGVAMAILSTVLSLVTGGHR